MSSACLNFLIFNRAGLLEGAGCGGLVAARPWIFMHLKTKLVNLVL